MTKFILKAFYLGHLELVEVYPSQGKAIKRRAGLASFNRQGWTYTITKQEN